MSRKAKTPTMKLVRNNAPQDSMKTDAVIAIVPLQEGIFAWIVEQPIRPIIR